MKTPSNAPRIVYVERLGDGVIVTFDDGKCAVYPAALLYAVFPQARELRDEALSEQS
jgi:hypothetical protein